MGCILLGIIRRCVKTSAIDARRILKDACGDCNVDEGSALDAVTAAASKFSSCVFIVMYSESPKVFDPPRPGLASIE